jgi:hypothetical protein
MDAGDLSVRGWTVLMEEFVFFLTGFMAALTSYIWTHYWMSVYNVVDYREAARSVGHFHYPSVLFDFVLIAAAAVASRV